MRLICNAAPKCENCNSHFQELRQNLREAIVLKHFKRDIKDERGVEKIVNDILDCQHINFTELHRFEEQINGISIFRAKKGRIHYVYGILKDKILFLRAFKNFIEYEKFLGDKKEIRYMVEQEHF